MSDLEPLEMLYEWDRGGEALPLPPGLSALYGPLRFPPHPDRPYVVGNFVTSLDGVAALEKPGYAGGGPISGRDPHDRMVMGLLRAVADAVVVGAGTQRAASPHHLWTAEYIDPARADSYQALRAGLGKSMFASGVRGRRGNTRESQSERTGVANYVPPVALHEPPSLRSGQ